ncbi:hypothetical protein Tco_0516045 [Tanacetum coccineum]
MLAAASPQVTSVKILGSVMVDLVWSTKEDSLTAGKTMKLPSKGLTIDEERVKDFVTKLVWEFDQDHQRWFRVVEVAVHVYEVDLIQVCVSCINLKGNFSMENGYGTVDLMEGFTVEKLWWTFPCNDNEVWLLEWDMSGMYFRTIGTDERKQRIEPTT